jgi:HEAT repeat protein
MKIYFFAFTMIAASQTVVGAHAPPESVEMQVYKLRYGDAVERAGAAKSLGTLGVSAAPAVPALVQILGNQDSIAIGDAVDALVHIGPAAVPALVQALESTDVRLRHQAAVVLSRIEPTDPAAVKALVKALKDPSAAIRRRAALALAGAGRCEKPEDGVVVGLISALADRDGTVRVSAAVALGDIGTDAKEAAKPLSQLLSDKDAGLRTAATEAIRKITASKPNRTP